MNVYSTEEEQLQAIQNWFKKYAKLIFISLAVIAVCVGTWNFKHVRNIAYVENASILYEKFQTATTDEDLTGLAEQLSSNYYDSVYGKIAKLYLVNKKAADQKWSEMADEYQVLFKNSGEWTDLQIIVFENWIRALLESNQIEAAHQQIIATENNKLVSLYPLNFFNLKGDVLAKLQKNQDAIDSYNKAVDSISDNQQMQQQTAQFLNWILLKRNDLLAAKPLA